MLAPDWPAQKPGHASAFSGKPIVSAPWKKEETQIPQTRKSGRQNNTSFFITCNVHYTMLVYNAPSFRHIENKFQGFTLNPEQCISFFSLEQKERDMVSQITYGCQQCKLQSQGTFQAQCVRLINITNKYQRKIKFLYKYDHMFLPRLLKQLFLPFLGKRTWYVNWINHDSYFKSDKRTEITLPPHQQFSRTAQTHHAQLPGDKCQPWPVSLPVPTTCSLPAGSEGLKDKPSNTIAWRALRLSSTKPS